MIKKSASFIWKIVVNQNSLMLMKEFILFKSEFISAFRSDDHFRYKISIPMTTRQVYKMTGFNGEIPSIETEAFPVLKSQNPDGVETSFIEPQTSKVITKTSFVTLGDKSLMILETRYIHGEKSRM